MPYNPERDVNLEQRPRSLTTEATDDDIRQKYPSLTNDQIRIMRGNAKMDPDFYKNPNQFDVIGREFEESNKSSSRRPGRPIKLLRSAAAAGRDGDTLLGHLSPGDVIVSRERQERDPQVRARLRELMGDDLDRFTAGSAWNSKHPHTGLPEFADPAPEINPSAPVQPGASAASITNSPTAGPTPPANKGAAAPTDTSLGGDASNPWTAIFSGLNPGGAQQPQPKTGQSEAYSALGGNNPLNLEAARTLAENQ